MSRTHWAIKQAANRFEIEAGYLPLVPARAVKPKASIGEDELVDFVRRVGVARTLDAAIAAEALAE
jgi:hypothetical protein